MLIFVSWALTGLLQKAAVAANDKYTLITILLNIISHPFFLSANVTKFDLAIFG